MLIKLVTSLANFGFPLRRFFALMSAFSLAVIAYLLIFTEIAIQQQYLTAMLLWFLWLFLCTLFIYQFSGDPLLAVNHGWWAKLKFKIRLGWRYFMLIVFAMLTIATLYFTYKLLII